MLYFGTKMNFCPQLTAVILHCGVKFCIRYLHIIFGVCEFVGIGTGRAAHPLWAKIKLRCYACREAVDNRALERGMFHLTECTV
jgi:hypothetical protein